MVDIHSGSTFTYTYTDSDYPASTWGSTLTIVNNTNRYEITGVASGDTHTFTATATTTAGYDSGDYSYFIQCTYAGAVYTVESGSVTIEPSPSNIHETRSQAKRNLDALNALYEGKLTNDVINYSIAGRSIAKLTPRQIREEIGYWQGIYNMELRQEKIDAGKISSSHIYIRM